MQNGFDDFDTQVTAEESFGEAEARDSMMELVEELEGTAREAEYDAFLSQYDNDPSPYDGTYSEE